MSPPLTDAVNNNWPAIFFVTQVVGFFVAIITIIIATHKVTNHFTIIKKDIEKLQSDYKDLKVTVEKEKEKLEDFRVIYRTDILVRRALEIRKQEQVETAEKKMEDK